MYFGLKKMITGQRISIPVQGLLVLGSHPLASECAGPYAGILEFDGVVESRRVLTEYVGDPRKPDGFKPPREERDFLAAGNSVDDELQEFGMEGYQESPSAWIDDWRILAKSFKLRLV